MSRGRGAKLGKRSWEHELILRSAQWVVELLSQWVLVKSLHQEAHT